MNAAMPLIHGLFGAAVAAGAWWFVRLVDGDRLHRFTGQYTFELGFAGFNLILGGIGGLWLGRRRTRRMRWAAGGGVLAAATSLAILTFTPGLDYDWPMIVFPAVAGFAAVIIATKAGARPGEPSVPASNTFLGAIPSVGLVATVLSLGVLLLHARLTYLLQSWLETFLLLTCVLIVQELRILRLERLLADSRNEVRTTAT